MWWISRDPLEERGGINLHGYIGNNPINFLDSLGLIEGSPNNIAKRKAINDIAKKYDGSTDWVKNAAKGPMKQGTYKCSQFVFDVTREAGAAAALDGINPFGDPLGDMGAYDPCDSTMQTSRSLTAASAALYLGARGLGAFDEWASTTNGGDRSGEPKPPGYNPSWPTGTDNRGPHYIDPNGTKWYPHPEDKGQWPHYDNDKGQRYPENALKPWENQKKPPYGNQSADNPWPKSCPTTPTPIPWWMRIPWPIFLPIPYPYPGFYGEPVPGGLSA